MTRTVALPALLVLAFVGPAAAASPPLPPIVVATCAPVTAGLAGAKLDNRGKVALDGTTVGTVSVNCPIDAGMLGAGSSHTITLTYLDGDGWGTGTVVTASVIEFNTVLGTRTVVGSFNSNQSPLPTTGLNTAAGAFSYSFDFSKSFYYLQVSAKRATSAQKAIAYLVGVN